MKYAIFLAVSLFFASPAFAQSIPTANISISGSEGPIIIKKGEIVALMWSSTDASYCKGSSSYPLPLSNYGWKDGTTWGSKDLSANGMDVVAAPNSEMKITITVYCYGSTGTSSPDSVVLEVVSEYPGINSTNPPSGSTPLTPSITPPFVGIGSPNGDRYRTYDSIKVRLNLSGHHVSPTTPVDMTLYLTDGSGSIKHKIFNLSGSSLFNNSTYETGTAPISPSIAQGDNYYIVAEVTDHTTGALITSGKNTVPFSVVTYSPVPASPEPVPVPSVAPAHTIQESSAPKIDTANTIPVPSKPTDVTAIPKKTIESPKGNSGAEMKPQLKNDTKQQVSNEKTAEGKKEAVTSKVKSPAKALKVEQKKSENKIKSFFRRLFGRDR